MIDRVSPTKPPGIVPGPVGLDPTYCSNRSTDELSSGSRKSFVMKKEKRLLRKGVLGCGPVSQAAHFEGALKARNAELYAICDRAENLAEKMAARFEPSKALTAVSKACRTGERVALADVDEEAIR